MRRFGLAVGVAAMLGSGMAGAETPDAAEQDEAFRAAMARLLEEVVGVQPDDPALQPVTACINDVFLDGLQPDEKQALIDAAAVENQQARFPALIAWFEHVNAAHPDLEEAAGACG